MKLDEPPFKPGDVVRFSESAQLRHPKWQGTPSGERVVDAVYPPGEGESDQWCFRAYGFSGVALCKDFQLA